MNYSKLIVNLSNIKENIEVLKRRQRSGCKTVAMVKADAYGLGMIEVTKYLENQNLVEYFGVAYLEEAIKLKESGIELPVIITSPGLISEIQELLRYNNIIPSVSYYEYAEALSEASKKIGKIQKIHIEINTGMNRFGVSYNQAIKFIERVSKLKNIEVEGIYTHFAAADSDASYTKMQQERFDNILDELERRKIHIPIVHVSNSAGSINVVNDRYTAIRPGIMMYGGYPDASLRNSVYIKPVCKLVSTIVDILDVEKDSVIGYNKTYTAMKDMQIATVNIGYADGLRRELSNKGKMLVLGNKCDIVGNVCMDSCMIDVTGIPDVKIGTEAVIFDYTNITIDNIANECNTINYEILTGVGNRVKREYIENII